MTASPGNAQSSRARGDVASKILQVLNERGPEKTACPSLIAREMGDDAWRDLMPLIRDVAGDLADEGRLRITRQGKPVDIEEVTGPIRLGLPQNSQS